MRGDHLPIIQALKNRQKSKAAPVQGPDLPRTLMVHHHEIPGLPGRKVGEPVTVRIQGHIHSQSNDGHAVVHVASIKPDSSETEKKQYPEQNVPERGIAEVRVRTQQSHA